VTVIAWDGKTLAADRACNIAGIHFEVTKVRRWKNAIFALAGSGTRLEQLMAWYRDGADPAKYPPRPTEDEGSVFVVVDQPDGKPRVRRFEGSGYPMLIESALYADGAARDVALAAMHCGKSARDAVLLANLLTAYCGNGVDELTLEG
jgi:hypothetical protein